MLDQIILGSKSSSCIIFGLENMNMNPSLSSYYDCYDSFQQSTECWGSCFVGLEFKMHQSA